MPQETGSSLTYRGSLPWKNRSHTGCIICYWVQCGLLFQRTCPLMLEVHVSWPCGHGLVRTFSSRPNIFKWLYDTTPGHRIAPVPFCVLIISWLSLSWPLNKQKFTASVALTVLQRLQETEGHCPALFQTHSHSTSSSQVLEDSWEEESKDRSWGAGLCGLWGCRGSTGGLCMSDTQAAEI